TRAACKYLKAAYKRHGSWTGAAASYNCGSGGINSRVTAQGSSNYYDLMLPEETNRYIFRILAFKHLMGNANEIGFVVAPNEKFHPYRTQTVTVTENIPDLASFARSHGSSYKLVKMLNPWLHSNKLSV